MTETHPTLENPAEQINLRIRNLESEAQIVIESSQDAESLKEQVLGRFEESEIPESDWELLQADGNIETLEKLSGYKLYSEEDTTEKLIQAALDNLTADEIVKTRLRTELQRILGDPLADEYRDKIAKVDQVKATFIEDKKQEILTLTTEMIRSFDYVGFINHTLDFESSSDLNTTDFIHRDLFDLTLIKQDLETEDEDLSKTELAGKFNSFFDSTNPFGSRMETISNFSSKYQEFVGKKPDQEVETVEDDEIKDVIQDLRDLEKQSRRFEELLKTYNWGEYFNPDRKRPDTSKMAFNLGTIYYPDRDDSIAETASSNDRLKSAIVAVYQERKRQWEEEGVIRRSQEFEDKIEGAEVNEILFQVTGLDEEKEGYERVITPESIPRWFIVDTMIKELLGEFSVYYAFPQKFLDDIGEIEFTHHSSWEIETGDDYDELSMEAWRSIYRRDIKETVVHEIFEKNATELSLDEMEGYEQAIEDDKDKLSGVSWYSRYSQANPDSKSWEKEDFCEAGAMYFERPEDLYLISPARYRFMVDYFARYLPKDQRQSYKHFRMSMVEKTNGKKTDEEKKQKTKQLTTHEAIPLEDLKEDPNKEKEKAVTVGRFIQAEKKPEAEGHKIEVVRRLYIPKVEGT